MTHGTTQDFASQLITGYWVQHDPYHSWLDEPRRFPSIHVAYDVSGLTPVWQDLFREAAARIDAATGLHLYEQTGGALGIDDEFSTFAGTYEPGADWSQHPASIYSAHVNVPQNWNVGQTREESLHDAEHELLHAVGLGHAGNYDESASGQGVLFDNDSSAMSIMSYYGPKTSALGPADVLAVRELYGLAPMPPHWTQSVVVGAYPSAAAPAGLGDFNRDGAADVAWFDPSSNSLDIWLLSGSHWAASSSVGSHPAGWSAAATGDFDGDGTSDAGWFNQSTGDFEFWRLSGAHWAGSVDVGSHPAGYAPVAGGDFDGNGVADVVWFNQSTGAVDIWELSAGGHWMASIYGGSHPGWRPVGASDYDRDGHADITWQGPDGALEVWFMSGGALISSAAIGSHPAGWTAIGTGDVDSSGTPDAAWYNPSTHQLETWLLAPTLI